MSSSAPNFVIQAASLWASGADSAFTGTGGPSFFEPFTSTFDDIVNSSGISAIPFADSVDNVAAGDQVTFVIALDNFGSTAYGVTLRNTVPAGFLVPVDDSDVTVVSGNGTPLDFTGDLFNPNGGLTITDPVAAFDSSSGDNVALVTFTLQAGSALAVPLATVSDNAQIVSDAATAGGPNVDAGNTTSLTASTNVTAAGITVTSAADQTSTSIGPNQTASYDITVTLSGGTAGNLLITQAASASGAAVLDISAVQIVSFGADLAATAPVTVQPGGVIALGNVTDTPNGPATAADQIVVRVTVAEGGASGGTGTLQTTVSANNPNQQNARWSSTTSNSVTLVPPSPPPVLSGASPQQTTTATTPILPFATLAVADPNANPSETLTITPSNLALGTLSAAGLTTDGAGNYLLSGSPSVVQAAVQSLVFTPSASGTETFALSLNDGLGTAARSVAVTVQPATTTSSFPQFLTSPQTILTSTATGTSTFAETQTYGGPLDNIQSQFLYDGSAPLAVVALHPDMLVSSQASATAVQLLAGNNLVDLPQGSGFMTSGTGDDTFLFNAAQSQPSWDTIVNFHPGDQVTLYGYQGGVSVQHWVDNIGAPGWTGATLELDLAGTGTVNNCITFEGLSLNTATHFSSQAGSVAGQNYLTLSAS